MDAPDGSIPCPQHSAFLRARPCLWLSFVVPLHETSVLTSRRWCIRRKRCTREIVLRPSLPHARPSLFLFATMQFYGDVRSSSVSRRPRSGAPAVTSRFRSSRDGAHYGATCSFQNQIFAQPCSSREPRLEHACTNTSLSLCQCSSHEHARAGWSASLVLLSWNRSLYISRPPTSRTAT